MLSRKQKEQISHAVINTLYSKFKDFPESSDSNRNAPFHEAFLAAFSEKLNRKVSTTPFLISISSWLHGLNSSLGSSFFEKVSHYLSGGEKRQYTAKKLGNLQIRQSQKSSINTIITRLSNADTTPNLIAENQTIGIDDNSELVNAIDFSADVFIEFDNEVIAIELKSVRPNSGEMRGEKQKILEGKAALQLLFPEKKINFYIGFPFDPTEMQGSTGYNKIRLMDSIINMRKFFAPDEVLVADELWNFLSDDNNTMEQILEIINRIATPKFEEIFQYLNNPINRENNRLEYLYTLKNWYLFSEMYLVSKDMIIKDSISNKKRITSKYNQFIFQDGEYNESRFTTLLAHTHRSQFSLNI